jgi:UDP-N-acetylglucosamine 2-epimerase (non-hydrolysing)
MKRKKILCVVGTRPEAIKMAPIILRLQERKGDFELLTVAAAQHRELLDDVFTVFRIHPDTDLDIMRPNQTLADIAVRVLEAMPSLFDSFHPDVVMAQGDTTTVMATAMACYFNAARFAHVEAGLRTGNLFAPYPEEFNRRVAALAAHYHFAPTEGAQRNLLAEGVPPARIHVTGNPIVDALRYILARTQPPPSPVPAGTPYVLMTCHRRESFGPAIRGIFGAVRDFADRHPGLRVWYPVHPNPNVSVPAREILADLPNILLTEPLDYITFLHALKGCRFLLTDSGGIQEEGVTLGKPVLVLRNVTERPEGVEAGGCQLVGTDPEAVGSWLERLLTDDGIYEKMSSASAVFGDGRTADQIADILAVD